jgi:magnesium transporter
MIRVFLLDRRDGTTRWGDGGLLVSLPPNSEDYVIWVDAQNPTEEEEQLLLTRWFPVHDLTMEDISRPRRLPEQSPHLPKVEEFANHLFIITNPVRSSQIEEPGPLDACQLSAVLNRHVLITVHYCVLPGIDEVQSQLHRHTTLAERGPDFLFHLVLDATVDGYVPLLETIENRLDEMETNLFASSACLVLEQLLAWKRTIVSLRKTVLHEREVLYRLVRGEFAFIDQREVAYYRDVSDHLFRFAEMLENSREMVSDLLQNHLAHASHRLNEVMKVLTAVSTIILPMTLISGIYGMNFKEMPETNWAIGYPMALCLMVVAGSCTYWFYRSRGWL